MDDQFSNLRLAIKNSQSNRELTLAVVNLLSQVELTISRANRELKVECLFEVANLLSRGQGKEHIWAWLNAIATSANDELKELLTICIFELIPEEPIEWDSVYKIWDFARVETTKWVIDNAYRRFPNERGYHAIKYLDYCQSAVLE